MDFQILDSLMKWVVVPLVGWVWLLWRANGDHRTEIAVLKTQLWALDAKAAANAASIDAKVTANATASAKQFDRIMEKLDHIEDVIRK